MALRTYEQLFGSSADAILYYKSNFPNDTTSDADLATNIKYAFMKIEPIFGSFRNYDISEDTTRNNHIKNAVVFESNSIMQSQKIATVEVNGINPSNIDMNVKSEKFEDVTTVYKDTNLHALELMNTLGLLSQSASTLLNRYIRRSYPHA